jgi:hypothetical protein
MRTLVRRIRLVMRTYSAGSIYTYMLRRGKATAAVAVNNLVQSPLSLVGVLFFYVIDAPASASDLQQQQVCKERKGRERGSCGGETQ